MKTLRLLFVFLVFFQCSSQKNVEMRIGIFHLLSPLDPFNNSSSLSSDLIDMIFDSLIRINSKGEISSSLCDKWSFNENSLQWKFHLRNNIRFHDSSVITPEDVLFSLNKVFSSNHSLLSIFNTSVKDIHLEQNNSIVIQLKKKDSSFLASLQEAKIVPKQYFSNSETEKRFIENPIGSGPFKVAQQSPSEILLEANSNYSEKAPFLKKIRILSFENEDAVLNQLIGEKIDFIFLLSPQDYGILEKIKKLKIYENWFPILYSIFFNFQKAQFQHTYLREAFDLAINKERLIREVLFNHGECSIGTEINSCNQLYDPPKARELLVKSGWKLSQKTGIFEKGKEKLEFKINSIKGDRISEESLKRIKEDLLNVGIKLDIVALDSNDFSRLIFKEKNFDLSFHMSVFRPYYQIEYAYFHSSQIESGINISSYKNSDLDTALEEYREAPDNSVAFQNLQKLLKLQKPALFLFWRRMPIVVNERFKGIPKERMESLRDLMYVYEK